MSGSFKDFTFRQELKPPVDAVGERPENGSDPELHRGRRVGGDDGQGDDVTDHVDPDQG